jgi:hypothetical protein
MCGWYSNGAAATSAKRVARSGISYHTLQAYLRYAHKLQASGVQESPPEYLPDS